MAEKAYSQNRQALKFYTAFGEENVSKLFKCKICGGVKNGNKISNLVTHLKTVHNDVYSNEVKRSAVCSELTLKLERLQLLQICVELVTLNKQPFAAVLYSGFQKLISDKLINFDKAGIPLDLRSTSLTPLKDHIRRTASKVREKIKEELKGRLLSASADIVTKINRSILGMYVQFISNCKLEVRCIGMLEMHERHTGKYISEMAQKCMNEYGVGFINLYSITTDNASNMRAFVKNANQAVEDGNEFQLDRMTISDQDDDAFDVNNAANSSELDELLSSLVPSEATWSFSNYDSNELGEYIRKDNPHLLVNGINCAAHTLQLVVKEALSNLSSEHQNVIVYCREFAKFTRLQTTICEIKARGVEKRFPPLDVPTRWSSTYIMVNE